MIEPSAKPRFPRVLMLCSNHCELIVWVRLAIKPIKRTIRKATRKPAAAAHERLRIEIIPSRAYTPRLESVMTARKGTFHIAMAGNELLMVSFLSRVSLMTGNNIPKYPNAIRMNCAWLIQWISS